jgi:hypothetical protein
MNFGSGFLYAEPSAVEGVARLLDFGGTLVEFNNSPAPDQIALRADWWVVAADVRTVMQADANRQLSLFGDQR